MNFIAMFCAFVSVVACTARADYALERGAAKDGLLMTDGVKPGSYHVRLEGFSGDDATTRAKAIALYEKAIRAKPVDLGIYRSIAALYEADGDLEGALATYRRSLEADYNQPDLWDLEKTMETKVKDNK